MVIHHVGVPYDPETVKPRFSVSGPYSVAPSHPDYIAWHARQYMGMCCLVCGAYLGQARELWGAWHCGYHICADAARWWRTMQWRRARYPGLTRELHGLEVLTRYLEWLANQKRRKH